MKERVSPAPVSTRTVRASSLSGETGDGAGDRSIDVIGARRGRNPFIFCSPHSGRRYDPDFLSQCQVSPDALRRLEDGYVDLLFADAPQRGSPLLCALFPRAFVDVNRARTDLDPYVIKDLPPQTDTAHPLWVAAGYGVIPRLAHNGEPIYPERLSPAEAESRLAGCYDVYHAALQRLIDEARAEFGFAVVIDCHSMPAPLLPHHVDQTRSRRNASTFSGHAETGWSREIMARQRPAESGRGRSARQPTRAQSGPDIVLGDKYGTSCDPALTDICDGILSALGYRVRRNFPYAGGHVTRHYGNPYHGVHVIQIEINRRLYLDESRAVRHQGFDGQRRKITQFVSALVHNERLLSLESSPSPRLAAE